LSNCDIVEAPKNALSDLMFSVDLEIGVKCNAFEINNIEISKEKLE